MSIKMTTEFKHNVMVAVLVLAFIVVLAAVLFAFRWFSQATMPQDVVSPRPGIECLIVSGSDGVGVSCYPTAGLPPRN